MKTGSILFRAIALILITAFISSCNPKAPETVNAIPADASFVMSIDGGSLASKSGVDDITETKAFRKMKENLSSSDLEAMMEFESLIKNPTESGVAMNKESFVFATMKEDNVTAGFVVELVDKAKFETLLKAQFEKNEIAVTIEQLDGVSLLKATGFEDDITLVWKENIALFLAHQSGDKEAVNQMAANLLNNEKDQSIASNKDFMNFYSKKEDISLWMNYEALMDLQKQNMGMAGEMMNMDLSECYLHGYLNFAKGKVEFSFETILNQKMQEMYKDFPFMKDGLDTDIMDYMPEPSLMSFAFGINMFNYYQYMLEVMGETTKAQISIFTPTVEETLGMTIQEALEAIDGDLIVNIHGYTMGEYGPGMPKFTAVLSIEDEKIIDVLMENGGSMLEELDGYYKMNNGDEAIFMTYHDGYIFASNEEHLVKGYVNGDKVESPLSNSAMAKLISQKPAYYSITMDMDAYPEAMQNMLKEGDAEMFSVLKNASSIYEKAEFIPKDSYSGSVILWLNNEKANSLQQIIQNADESIDMIDSNDPV